MGRRRILIPLSLATSFVANLLAFGPFVLIWLIVRQLLSPQFEANLEVIKAWSWGTLGFALGYILLYFIALMLSHLAAFRTERSIRYRSMQQAIHMPLGFHDQETTGRMRKILDDNAGMIHTFTAHQLPDLVGALTCLVVLIVLLIVVDWRMGLVSFIPIIISFVLMGSMMRSKAYRDSMTHYMDHLEKMNTEAIEYVRGIPVVKTFQQSVFTFSRFHKTIQDYHEWVIKYAMSCRKPMTWYTIASNSFGFFLIPLALYLIWQGEMWQGVLVNLIFFMIAMPLYGQNMIKLMYLISGYRESQQALDRIDALFAESDPLFGDKPFTPGDYDIALKDVTFRYTPESAPVIQSMSLTIHQGERVALVGASGSGKTTIARLIARFWDPTSGSIHIGKNLLSETDPSEILKHLSFVFQNDKLFKTTIRENIAYGAPQASEAEILQAAHLASCDDLLAKLPDGLDTVIGAEGTYLSGGEQQRIALARAFLKNAPILLLDEATAFADPENERAIQSVLKNLMKGKTVLLIAHRLTTVTDVDRVVVLDHGQVAEEGSHEALLERGGLYSNMWKEYQQSIQWRV